jgi:hypothetical protein
MAATYVLTLDGWNGVLERINALATNPPEGCDAVDELPLVEAPHRWSETDIAAAREKLNEICSNNVFDAPSTGKWLQAIIDELDAAVDNGWCNCEPTIPCCVPAHTLHGVPAGWSGSTVVTQYLYGNINYSQAAEYLGEDVMAHLVECVAPGTGEIIHYTLRHIHWIDCIYQDRWVDNNAIRQVGGLDEYWYTCSNSDVTILDSGWVPSLTPSYQSSTSVGSHNYYDEPMPGGGYHYDYQAERWYLTNWIGYFEVDSYVYDLYVSYVCP